MKKILFISLLLGSCFTINSAFCQQNDAKAVEFLDPHLQTMFKVLNSKPDTISATCMDSLKKLHSFKEKISKKTTVSDVQNEVNAAILRSFYTNSIQFCDTDVENICSHRVEPSIRKICKELSVQN